MFSPCRLFQAERWRRPPLRSLCSPCLANTHRNPSEADSPLSTLRTIPDRQRRPTSPLAGRRIVQPGNYGIRCTTSRARTLFGNDVTSRCRNDRTTAARSSARRFAGRGCHSRPRSLCHRAPRARGATSGTSQETPRAARSPRVDDASELRVGLCFHVLPG